MADADKTRGASGLAPDAGETRVDPPTLADVKHVTARNLVRGREWTRENRDRAIAALRASAVPWSGRFPVTLWAGGKTSTYTGSASNPGKGKCYEPTVEKYAGQLEKYASKIYAKGAGDAASHGRSRFGGSSDGECVERSAILCDADERGLVDSLQSSLKDANLSFVAQSRVDADKHHVVLFLARPLKATEDPKEIYRWKNDYYRPVLGWVLGILSEIAGLQYDLVWQAKNGRKAVDIPKLGFDPSTDRLLQLEFLYSRRKEGDAVPLTSHHAGHALDIDVFLAATGFAVEQQVVEDDEEGDPEPDPETVENKRIDDELRRAFRKPGVLKAAFEAVGWLGDPVGDDRHAALCPWRSLHSENTDGTSSTVVWTKGVFHCSHTHCAGRTVEEVYSALPDPGKAIVDAARAELPRMIVIGVDEERVNDEAIAALATHPAVYERGNALVHVVREAAKGAGILREVGAPRIGILKVPTIREMLAARARWMQYEGKKLCSAHPPGWSVAAVSARGSWPGVRNLEAVVESPVLRPDGSVLDTPGYDAATGLFFIPNGQYPPVPSQPTKTDVARAIEMLLDVVVDFPFASLCHRSAWVSGVITPLARYAYAGPTPFTIVDANTRGTGKTLLTDSFGLIASGRPMARMAHVEDDDEMRKRITAIAIAGDPMILIDNVAGVLGGPSLDAALTATSWKDRILGESRTIEVPFYSIWYATGNNIVLGPDTVRRALHVRLEAKEENPEERQAFKHHDLLGWIRVNRPALVVAALTLLRAYFVAGAPDQGLKAWGSFEGWSRCVRHCLVWAGLADPGETRAELAEGVDQERRLIALMIEGLDALDPSLQGGHTASQIIAAGQRPGTGGAGLQNEALGEALASMTDRSGKPNPQSVGVRLRHLRRRVVGGKMLDCKDNSKKGTLWFTVQVRPDEAAEQEPKNEPNRDKPASEPVTEEEPDLSCPGAS